MVSLIRMARFVEHRMQLNMQTEEPKLLMMAAMLYLSDWEALMESLSIKYQEDGPVSFRLIDEVILQFQLFFNWKSLEHSRRMK